MFPTNYAKFGDARLVSLDEVLFDDGARPGSLPPRYYARLVGRDIPGFPATKELSGTS
jgi:hypothetical protein